MTIQVGSFVRSNYLANNRDKAGIVTANNANPKLPAVPGGELTPSVGITVLPLDGKYVSQSFTERAGQVNILAGPYDSRFAAGKIVRISKPIAGSKIGDVGVVVAPESNSGLLTVRFLGQVCEIHPEYVTSSNDCRQIRCGRRQAIALAMPRVDMLMVIFCDNKDVVSFISTNHVTWPTSSDGIIWTLPPSLPEIKNDNPLIDSIMAQEDAKFIKHIEEAIMIEETMKEKSYLDDCLLGDNLRRIRMCHNNEAAVIITGDKGGRMMVGYPDGRVAWVNNSEYYVSGCKLNKQDVVRIIPGIPKRKTFTQEIGFYSDFGRALGRIGILQENTPDWGDGNPLNSVFLSTAENLLRASLSWFMPLAKIRYMKPFHEAYGKLCFYEHLSKDKSYWLHYYHHGVLRSEIRSEQSWQEDSAQGYITSHILLAGDDILVSDNRSGKVVNQITDDTYLCEVSYCKDKISIKEHDIVKVNYAHLPFVAKLLDGSIKPLDLPMKEFPRNEEKPFKVDDVVIIGTTAPLPAIATLNALKTYNGYYAIINDVRENDVSLTVVGLSNGPTWIVLAKSSQFCAKNVPFDFVKKCDIRLIVAEKGSWVKIDDNYWNHHTSSRGYAGKSGKVLWEHGNCLIIKSSFNTKLRVHKFFLTSTRSFAMASVEKMSTAAIWLAIGATTVALVGPFGKPTSAPQVIKEENTGKTNFYISALGDGGSVETLTVPPKEKIWFDGEQYTIIDIRAPRSPQEIAASKVVGNGKVITLQDVKGRCRQVIWAE